MSALVVTAYPTSGSEQKAASFFISLSRELNRTAERIEKLKTLLEGVSFFAVQHHYRQILSLHQEYFFLEHQILTTMHLISMGLYDPSSRESGRSRQKLEDEVSALQLRCDTIQNRIFRPKKASSIL